MPTHEHYLSCALFLASKGLATAMPNLSVDAEIIYKGTIIGESHAEVNVINAVKDRVLFILRRTLHSEQKDTFV